MHKVSNISYTSLFYFAYIHFYHYKLKLDGCRNGKGKKNTTQETKNVNILLLEYPDKNKFMFKFYKYICMKMNKEIVKRILFYKNLN